MAAGTTVMMAGTAMTVHGQVTYVLLIYNHTCLALVLSSCCVT